MDICQIQLGREGELTLFFWGVAGSIHNVSSSSIGGACGDPSLFFIPLAPFFASRGLPDALVDTSTSTATNLFARDRFRGFHSTSLAFDFFSRNCDAFMLWRFMTRWGTLRRVVSRRVACCDVFDGDY
jgi:hypothetical protein